MKKIILATVLAALSSTAALAADLGARAPYAKAAPAMMTVVSNWSGFYIGGNVGYGWGNGRTHFEDVITTAGFTAGTTPTTMDTRSNGVIGGAQIGSHEDSTTEAPLVLGTVSAYAAPAR